MANDRVEKQAGELCKELSKQFPEATLAIVNAHDDKKDIWINYEGKIIKIPYYIFSDEKCWENNNIYEMLENNDKFWFLSVALVQGEARLVIKIHSQKEYETLMEYCPGMNYFENQYYIRDYKTTWWDYDPSNE